jgi:hypothetical protein
VLCYALRLTSDPYNGMKIILGFAQEAVEVFKKNPLTEFDASPLNNVTADEPLLLKPSRDRDIPRLPNQAKVFLKAPRVIGKTVGLSVVMNRTCVTIITSTVEP